MFDFCRVRADNVAVMASRPLFIIAALFMLLNGGVLGLMHKSLSRDVQPSAIDWRIGTLLLSGGWILLAVQDMLPAGFILPLANGLLFCGLALYWRAMQRFFGRNGHVSTWLPALLGVIGIYWFSAVTPSFAGRFALSSLILSSYCFAAAWPVYRYGRGIARSSSLALAGIFVFVGTVVFCRGAYFVLAPELASSLLEMGPWSTMAISFVVAVLPVIGTTTFLVMCSERVRRQWEVAAATDYLTGLPNRRSIMGIGAARFNAARRKDTGFALAVIDVDRFKSVNDRFGHDGGDRALKHVAQVLDRHCRGPNMVGRQGGEEFVALLEVLDKREAHAAAERLRDALEANPLAIDATMLVLTVSVGVAMIARDDISLDDMLRRADAALYTAKSSGRNRVELR